MPFDCCLPTPEAPSRPSLLPVRLPTRLRRMQQALHAGYKQGGATSKHRTPTGASTWNPANKPGFSINASIQHQCMAPCLLHGPPRKMQMEGLRPAVVAAGEDVAGRMHASNLTVMSICPLRCAFVNTLLCHLNCRFWLPPLCRKSHFRSLETLVIQLHHDAGKSSCLQGLCSVHLADEERDAVCSAARSLDPSGGPASKCRASVHKFRRWPELPATQVRE